MPIGLDGMDRGYYGRDDVRIEYERAMRQLHEVMRELEHFKERAASSAGQAEYFQREISANAKYIRVLELALFLASGTDEKKADFLTKAKTSIDVLKTFEK